ncbi:MAG: glycerol-3-phosphate 1-O-acyltransferase PlsY, partial [Clostridiales bacterium]|jgi:glycerol-3-phosphate acyltransferase PlsY|nr:glycerol-3-phosphate 1-O-acyltransferase PlsY [Clostridiales bacterium]
MARLFCLAAGYLLGCIQTAYLAGKLKANIDIRQFGSGNAGTTNAARVLGAPVGVIVFVADMLKAVIAYFLCQALWGPNSTLPLGGFALAGIYGGAGAILGHNFPFFLGFRGGKGVASSLGLMVAFDWKLALICYAIGVTLIATTKYISVGSLAMLVLFPILTLTFGHPFEALAVTIFLAVMAIVQHRENIKRLIAGKENKFKLKKEGTYKKEDSKAPEK